MPKTSPKKLASVRAYQERNKARILAKKKADYAANRERILARRAHYSIDKAGRQAYNRLYHEEHYAAIVAHQKAYYLANKAKVLAANRLQYVKYPARFKEYGRKHRARKRGAPISDLTAAQWQAIKEAYGHCCVYCGKRQQRLTQDHIIPLSKGGSHTVQNVVPACRSCNSKKGAGAPLIPVQPLLFA